METVRKITPVTNAEHELDSFFFECTNCKVLELCEGNTILEDYGYITIKDGCFIYTGKFWDVYDWYMLGADFEEFYNEVVFKVKDDERYY